jgi:LmbE family N-acetylglucosaminyl deacetylase
MILFTVPHMDDGVLACGGTIAKLSQKQQVHIVYATDGMRSPAPVLPWWDSTSTDLGQVRMREAREAMRGLGVPEQNVHFLNLPEGQLRKYGKTLISSLTDLIEQIEPAFVFMPFRYDRHVDHLALNCVVTTTVQERAFQAELIEYFVYYRWRLLPEQDVRKYISFHHLFEIDIVDVSAQKRAALDCFKSQTTRYYDWQTRPNLTQRLLDEVSRAPEFFLRYDDSVPGPAVFSRAATWIRVAHRLEPLLKKKKDQAVALWWRIFDRDARKTP